MNIHTTHETSTSTALRLPRPLQVRIERWAAAGYPHEACGVLLGHKLDSHVFVTDVRRARNLNVERANDRYELDPVDLLAAEEDAQSRGLDVVGIWHSHPDHPAEPSEFDRATAWEGWSYVIVSVSSDGPRALRSFRLAEGAFVDEEIEV